MTTNVGWNAVPVGRGPGGAGFGPAAADPGAVARFEQAMAAPESAPAAAPAPAIQASDAELRRLLPADAARLRARYGGDDAAFRRDALVLVKIQDKIIESGILKAAREALENNPFDEDR